MKPTHFSAGTPVVVGCGELAHTLLDFPRLLARDSENARHPETLECTAACAPIMMRGGVLAYTLLGMDCNTTLTFHTAGSEHLETLLQARRS